MNPDSDHCTADGENRDKNATVMNYLCPECGANKGHHIYDHLLAVHFYSKDDIERVKMERRSRKLMPGTNEVYSCDVCGLLCKNKRTLAKHKKRKHADQESIDVKRCLLCPLCEEQVKNHWDLIEHVNEEHSTSHEHWVVEAESFDDKNKFEEWKAQLENEAAVRFSVVSRRKVAGGSVTYMRCSRANPFSGYVNVERPGSKKIVGNCTAFMKVRENANVFHVKFCRTHCGHEMERAILRMDARSEEYIASLLKDGFTPHQILKKIRAEYRNNGKHSRIYYTTYSDVRHVAIKNKIDSSRKDESDVRSPAIRVRERTEDDGIRLYTLAVNETGDGFSLGEMSQFDEQDSYLHDSMAVGRTNVDTLGANKELLQEFESINAAVRSKLVSLSKVADEAVHDRMKELIEIMKDIDAKASCEMALHRTRNTWRPQIARCAELSLNK